jgi:hypothetical protein
MATSQTSPSTRAKRAVARRKPRAAARPRTAARRASTAATSRSTTSTRPASRVERAQQLAERAVLVPVGVALEARDRVAGTVGELVTATRSRTALEKQLKRFERRGGSARTQLEREVRRTRTRLEQQTRSARRGFDRQREQARKTLGSNARKTLVPNVEGLTGRVENVVQNGVQTGKKLVNGAQDRISSVV